MEFPSACDQRLLGFRVVRIGNAAVNRAYCRTLLLIEKSDALRTLVWSDIIGVLAKRLVRLSVEFPLSATLVDSGVRALRLTCAAVNAFLRDQCRHFPLFSRPGKSLA